MSWAPWEALYQWNPFEIDALGLVTLLGAQEVDNAVGRLVLSRYLEFMPVLGFYVIAGNRFTEKAAGFHLYNITQGIHTTDLAGWLTRWMISQDFETTRSFVEWKVTPPKNRRTDTIVAVLISFVFNGFLIVLTVMSRDWYGFTNTIAMIASVAVRAYIVGQNRAGIDAMVDEAVSKHLKPLDKSSYEQARLNYSKFRARRKSVATKEKAESDDRKRAARAAKSGQKIIEGSANDLLPYPPGEKSPPEGTEAVPLTRKPKVKTFNTDEAWGGVPTKVLMIQSDSKAVTFWMPAELLFPPSPFIESPRVLHPQTYYVVRFLGWLIFAVHIVAIGMAKLASQLYTVFLLVLPTLLIVLKCGCDDSKWLEYFRYWRKRFHNWRHRTDPDSYLSPDEAGKRTEFQYKRSCHIGSRLRADIYEWPETYDFYNFKDIDPPMDGKWESDPLPFNVERTKKRQDLYAWLALTHDEEESMDKWDLFPHLRGGNNDWWKLYKKKKNALKPHSSMGPKREQKVPRQQARPTTTGTDDQDNFSAPSFRMRRTDTSNFGLSNAHSHMHSSAFPAISANATISEDGSCNTPDDVLTPSEDQAQSDPLDERCEDGAKEHTS